MPRVELKGDNNVIYLNQPSAFLMHRVELKVMFSSQGSVQNQGFLMHRVELKALYALGQTSRDTPVPNAPCGVERKASKL